MLELAIADKWPRMIDESSELSIKICLELFVAGLIHGHRAQKQDGSDSFCKSYITVAGREYLNKLQRQAFDASTMGQIKQYGLAFCSWLVGVFTPTAANLIGAWFS